jgi:putative membrane protein
MRGFPSFFSYLLLFFKGMAMGAADVVPGVSGGTIAFITGIYTELIESLSSFSRGALRELFRGKIRGFWERINGTFLVILFSGILLSIFSIARLMEFLLHHYPIMVWSFFCGLVVLSGFVVLKRTGGWSGRVIISFLAGIVVMIAITMVTPSETTEALWFVFLSGAIAICAMILPGISGAFILLIMGKYLFILQAVSSFDIKVLMVFGAGVVTGLLSFANILSWLLRRYYDITVAILSGFIIGSLNKLWPWKETVATVADTHGGVIPVVERNIFPGSYFELTGNDPHLFAALLLFAAGAMLVIVLDRFSPEK